MYRMNRKTNILLLLAGLFFISGCLKDDCRRAVTYTVIEPVYKTIDEIRQGEVVLEAPRPLRKPGKIYYYNQFVLINESREGVHIIDNTDPSMPVRTAFLRIPGNEDIAVRNGLLYASSYIDLLTISLEDYTLVHRTKDVFPPMWEDLQNNQVAVYFEERQVTEILDCEVYNELYLVDGNLIRLDAGGSSTTFFTSDMFNAYSSQTNRENALGGSGTGTGGSMARFTIVGEYLYVVDQTSLEVFDLSQPQAPVSAARVDIGWGIETIFPYEDKLFIGSNSGMFIYDNSQPTQPVQLAAFAHARACDPVYVQGNRAWVTLRSGNICEGFTNQLDLIDITNLTAPVLLRSFPMDNPHGLSIMDNDLFLCEGTFGLKWFDITEPLDLNQHFLAKENRHSFDVISVPGGGRQLLLIGDDGFYQYDVQEKGTFRLLSKIPVQP
jgi:hypothetical protein